jgi:hypothetical protein
MPDEHTQWERVSSSPMQKPGIHPRQKTDERRRKPKADNRYRDEADRDQLLLRWWTTVIILLALIAVLIWQVFFV